MTTRPQWHIVIASFAAGVSLMGLAMALTDERAGVARDLYRKAVDEQRDQINRCAKTITLLPRRQ